MSFCAELRAGIHYAVLVLRQSPPNRRPPGFPWCPGAGSCRGHLGQRPSFGGVDLRC